MGQISMLTLVAAVTLVMGGAHVSESSGTVGPIAQSGTVLPFGVSLAGQSAVLANKDDIVAKVSKAVANAAELVVDVNDNPIIINVFASDAEGNPKQGATPAIILINSGNKTTLDQTMDQKKLEAGHYLMNVVASGSTARVVFQVK